MPGILKVHGRKEIGALIISILISEGTGYLSAAFSGTSNFKYESLSLPEFAPPAWIFAPVWVFLYFLMALAAYRIWLHGSSRPKVRSALSAYIIQLVLNFLWSIIFFRLNLYAIAFFEIILLIILIILTTIKFLKIDKLSGLLLIPYLLWTVFAAVLNYFVWMMNM
jgi:tryptophan-rich sensory protein